MSYRHSINKKMSNSLWQPHGQHNAIHQLIEEVRKRPQLWNSKHPLYHTRPLVADNWEEIANIIGVPSNLYANSRMLRMNNDNLNPANMVKTKWKGLRDNFRKEVKKCLRLGENYVPWVHFKACNFLWTVLDTSHFECSQEQIDEMKQRFEVPEEEDFESGEVGYSEVDDPYQVHYRNIDAQQQSEENSMDFHDYIFSGDSYMEQGLNEEARLEPGELEPAEIAPGDDDDVQIIEPQIGTVEVQNDTSEPQFLKISSARSLAHLEPEQGAVLQKIQQIKALEKRLTEPPKLTPFYKQPKSINKIKSQFETDDTDTHFFKSILPYMAQLEPITKKRLKDEIKQLVMETVEKKTDEFSFKKIRLVKNWENTNENSPSSDVNNEDSGGALVNSEPETIIS